MTTDNRGSKNPFRLLMYVPVPWVFVLTYLVGAAVQTMHPSTVARDTARSSEMVGAALFALGAVIAGWALVIFRKARTTTVPGRASVKLVTWGPYRFSRNPMYVGLTCAYLGEAALLKQIWPVLLLPLIIAYLNWTVIPVEETRLQEVFLDEYERYRASVRRWL